MMRLLARFSWLLLVGVGLTIPHGIVKHRKHFNWEEINFLLAFGDSYTYVQGTLGLQNYSFIGNLQNYSFTPSQLLNNKIVQNQIGTSAGGPNWVEYLTGCFSGMPSKCRRQLWDFAFAGSDVSTTYTSLHHNYTVSFVNQVAQWTYYARPIVSADASKSLVAAWIGINDISDTAKYAFPRANNVASFSALYGEIIDIEFQALDAVYDAGYRNYLIMNLPPLERTPTNVLPGATPLPNATMVQLYNFQISSHAAAFETSHPGSKAMVFDTYAYLKGILGDPSQYGILNTTGYCAYYDVPDIGTRYASYGCLPIEDYFWYNTGHVTYRVHELMAEAVGEFLRGEGCGSFGKRAS